MDPSSLCSQGVTQPEAGHGNGGLNQGGSGLPLECSGIDQGRPSLGSQLQQPFVEATNQFQLLSPQQPLPPQIQHFSYPPPPLLLQLLQLPPLQLPQLQLQLLQLPPQLLQWPLQLQWPPQLQQLLQWLQRLRHEWLLGLPLQLVQWLMQQLEQPQPQQQLLPPQLQQQLLQWLLKLPRPPLQRMLKRLLRLPPPPELLQLQPLQQWLLQLPLQLQQQLLLRLLRLQWLLQLKKELPEMQLLPQLLQESALQQLQLRDREVIEARLSSRSAPPSKVARVDNTSRGNSPPVTFKASSLVSTPSVGARPCSHRAASPAVSPQPATSSATIATPESSSPVVPSAPCSCPSRLGALAGAPTWAGPMLGNSMVIKEKLERFVFPPEVTQINALGTERVIDTFLEGLAQASTASVCLLSRVQHNSQLKQDNESMQKELSIAQGKIAALEAARGASEADLTAAHERATKAEDELVKAREKATKAEAELVKVRERALLSEAELVKARDRTSQAERELEDGFADAFINGYEELRWKISIAFPDIDFSGFVPIEAPDDSNGRFDDEDDTGDDAEDEEDSSESD